MSRPRVNSEAQKQLDKAEENFREFDESIKSLTFDRMNQESKKQELEPQTKLSQSEIEKSKDIYLKPTTTIGSVEKFNEKFREDYQFASEYVHLIAENKEIIGETIDIWTKPFPGVPAQYWKVPTNKPIWAPRFVAEQIKKCSYHRLTMNQNVSTGGDGMGSYYGHMVVDNIIQRLDANPISNRKSIFTGSHSFKAA